MDVKISSGHRRKLPVAATTCFSFPWHGRHFTNSFYLVFKWILLKTSAKVFVVEDLDRSRLVAMKVVNKSLLKKMSINFEASYRSDGFKREMAVLKRLRHPNIVRLYEVIDDPKHNLLYLALEYFDGGDLGDSSIPTPSIKEDVAKRWSRDILEALRYCHDNNVVHRDLKTENILKVKDGSRVALVDFGMSHMWDMQDVDMGGNGKDKKSLDKLKKAMVSCDVKSEFTSHDQTFLTSYITLLDACKPGDILLFCPRNFKG